MKFTGRMIAMAAVMFAASACGKKSGEPTGTTAEGPSGEGTNTETKTTTDAGTDTATDKKTTTPGTLAIVEFGAIAVNANAVVPEGASASLADQRNANPLYKAGDLSLAVSSGAGLTSSGFGLNALIAAKAEPNPQQISSGAPDELKVYVTKISLNKKTDGAPAVIFESATGAPMVFKKDGSVDLSAITEAAKTGPTSLRLAEPGEDPSKVKFGVEASGEYEVLRIEYLNAADVKGCVHAHWDDNPAGGVPQPADLAYHTYCTRAGKSSFDSTSATGFTAANFEVVDAGPQYGRPDNVADEPQETKLNLSKFWGNGLDALNAKFEVEYKLPKPIKLEADKTTGLSMIIDLNRLLRFNRNVGGSSMFQGSNTSGAFFFTTIWEEVAFASLGEPGRIYGFEVVVKACKKSEFTAPDTCATANNYFTIGAWLTAIMDPDGKPLSAILQPDDDNALTVVKGTWAGLQKSVPSAPIVTAGSDANHVDVHYRLDPKKESDPVDVCLTGGWLNDLPIGINDLDDTQLIETTFEARKCLPESDPEKDYTGPAWLVRML